jgi:short-subunit dehydrogenase
MEYLLPMTTLANSRIWITGASSGIGEALAYELARRGARLVLSARKESTLEIVRARCERPDTHDVVPLDLADQASVTAAAARTLGSGAVDVLVWPRTPGSTSTAASWRRTTSARWALRRPYFLRFSVAPWATSSS